jgi:hypothetical protein
VRVRSSIFFMPPILSPSIVRGSRPFYDTWHPLASAAFIFRPPSLT